MAKFDLDKVENIVRKEENAGDQHLLLSTQCICPPFNEVGVYCFAYVGRSISRPTPCPDDNKTQN